MKKAIFFSFQFSTVFLPCYSLIKMLRNILACIIASSAYIATLHLRQKKVTCWELHKNNQYKLCYIFPSVFEVKSARDRSLSIEYFPFSFFHYVLKFWLFLHVKKQTSSKCSTIHRIHGTKQRNRENIRSVFFSFVLDVNKKRQNISVFFVISRVGTLHWLLRPFSGSACRHTWRFSFFFSAISVV